ncbi:MAG TPA: glycosyltransferase family 4 protein [Vicinamibacterales bacterium]|jgi:glycosyltransferase involved in cell wall biosynthesis|nr:glycosyltransferase family 4 protein [Vicinamibacterales bacterium]
MTAPNAWLLVPGSIDTRTGGSIYGRRMAAALRARGWTIEVAELDDGFPRPAPAALHEAARVLAAIPDGSIVLVDGLAFGAMPSEVEREASRLRFAAIVHLPLAAEAGLDAATAARLEASETRALATASLVFVTGKSTMAAVERYGVARDRIVLVEPGTDRAPLARGGGGSPLQVLSVATLNPGKGHDILIHALASLPQRDWRLTCAGSLDRHPPTAERLRAMICGEGLQDHVTLTGELDDASLAAAYDDADLFVLATRHETYGMAVAEALAHGLPVVSTTTGAIPDLVGDHAGLLVPPGDEAALAAALARVMSDSHLRDRFAEGARRTRDRLPTWDDAAERMAAALEPLTH